jgi:hypothetical protein
VQRPDPVGEQERVLREPFQDQAQREAYRRARGRPQIRIGEGPHDLVHGVDAAGEVGVDHRAVDDLHGLGPPAGEPGVPEGGDDVSPSLEPGCGPTVQIGLVVRVEVVQAVAQQLGEQVVVAERVPVRIEADQQQVRRLQIGQGHRRSGRQRGRQARRELVGHAGVEQEAAHLGILGVDDLGGQVLGDHLRRPGQPLQERAEFARALHGDRGELQPGDPTLGAALQDVDLGCGQVEVHRPGERRGLGVVEAQVGPRGSRTTGPPSGAAPGVGAVPSWYRGRAATPGSRATRGRPRDRPPRGSPGGSRRSRP